MFSLGIFELFIILSLALIVLGPENFPKSARKFAVFFHQLKALQEELQKKASSFKKDLDSSSEEDKVSEEKTTHEKN